MAPDFVTWIVDSPFRTLRIFWMHRFLYKDDGTAGLHADDMGGPDAPLTKAGKMDSRILEGSGRKGNANLGEVG